MTVGTQHPQLWESVYNVLSSRILSGEYEPGLRLVETDLAEELSTSRGPIRSAFRELQRDGLVESDRRRGTFVARLSTEDIDELFSLRAAVETLAVQRAIERVTAADIQQLRMLVGEIDEFQDDLHHSLEADMAFHRAIYELAQHRRLLDVWNTMEAQIRAVAAAVAMIDSHVVHGSSSAHYELMDAIAARDARAGAQAVARHLKEARKTYS